MRGDLGITYDLEVLRLIDAFQNIGLYVGSVTITRFENQVHAIAFQKKLENLGIKVFRHYPIAGYPNDIEKSFQKKDLESMITLKQQNHLLS